jgi:hypothetical protein
MRLLVACIAIAGLVGLPVLAAWRRSGVDRIRQRRQPGADGYE